jgi:two-component system OmpR family sensor kinase/two-component system sensor histidine kinase BaeS
MILSYLAVALLTVLVVSALIRLTSGQSLMNLVVEQQTASLKETVQEYYTSNGTLEGFFNDYIELGPQRHPPPEPGGPAPGPDRREVRGLLGLVDSSYHALLPTLGYEVGQAVPQDSLRQAIAVEVDGETVAWILPDTNFQFQLSPEEELFLQRTTLAIGLAALAGVLAAVAIGYLLAGRLLKPIRLLTRASQALARGELDQQVPVTSRDELGLLTATFNQMSGDLVQADQQRKRMTADITHDLSTPLQIISGYIEMLEEGEVSLTPQRIDIIKTELGHLRRLVGDLSLLAQVEGGGLEFQLQEVQPEALLPHVYQAYQPIAARQGVELGLGVPESLPPILVDEGRMVQVLKNLLENAMRYTPRGGTIELGARTGGDGQQVVQLWVKDSGEGIEAEDLPYVFDRFYRADQARGGNSGKMGLGLAICKALVEAQGGAIAAESAGKGQGATMIITFEPAPVQET